MQCPFTDVPKEGKMNLMCSQFQRHLVFLSKRSFCAKRASKLIVLPKEMLVLFSIGTFLTNYDVKDRKLHCTSIYSTVRKRTMWEQNNSMETTIIGSLVTFRHIWSVLLFLGLVPVYKITYKSAKLTKNCFEVWLTKSKKILFEDLKKCN